MKPCEMSLHLGNIKLKNTIDGMVHLRKWLLARIMLATSMVSLAVNHHTKQLASRLGVKGEITALRLCNLTCEWQCKSRNSKLTCILGQPECLGPGSMQEAIRRLRSSGKRLMCQIFTCVVACESRCILNQMLE